jgi:hypothetical protein
MLLIFQKKKKRKGGNTRKYQKQGIGCTLKIYPWNMKNFVE